VDLSGWVQTDALAYGKITASMNFMSIPLRPLPGNLR